MSLVNTHTPQQAAAETKAAANLLQRKCACGTHTIGGAECDGCRGEGLKLQRAAVNRGVASDARLDTHTLSHSGPGFAHDFSRIPSHSSAPFTLQPKLTVNVPGDAYEQEADRIAEQVTATRARPALNVTPPHIQRFKVQSSGHMDAAPASVDRVLTSPGMPLEPALRRDMEQRFGQDFSRVRVHTGPAAEQSARDVSASAYTVGRDIAFGAGRFAPETYEGRRLLAHELTHVVQQSGADAPRAARIGARRGASPVSAARLATPVAVQRTCGEKQIGEIEIDDTLKLAEGDPGIAGTPVRFKVGCDEFLTKEDEAALQTLAKTLPPRARIIVHGFASEEGTKNFNIKLSAARAWKARTILSKLVDPSQIEGVFAHGGIPGNRADRRSVIIQTKDALPKITRALTIVSWIDGTNLPSFSRAALLIAPADTLPVLAACMALKCTANPTPPATLPASALSGFIGSKQYRAVQNYALTYVPSATVRGELVSKQTPGYTAPSSCGPIPPSDFQLGETSPLNHVTPDMSKPNPSVEALMKFRVGSAEESSALDEATSGAASLMFDLEDLRHVPWVWTQTHLHYDGSAGKLYWNVLGSAFPTHTIYLDGRRVDEITQGPCRVVTGSRFRRADKPRQTMQEEAKQAKVPIGKQEETVETGGRSNGSG